MPIIRNMVGRGKDVEVTFTKKSCRFCKQIFQPNSGSAIICGERECRLKRKRISQNIYYKRNAKEIYQSMLKYLPKRLSRQIAMRLFRKLGITLCQECGSNYRPQVHHIDFNPFNNSRNNLIMFCQIHHVKAHSKNCNN